MMDGDEQIAPQTVSARRTLKQTAQPRPARDQSDCFVEACLMQRLCDDVGKLKIEFVLWHAAGTIRAGRSSRVAHINEHSKCRSGALPLSLPCCVTASSARASCSVVPVSITASATSRRTLLLMTIIDYNCADAAALQP